LLLGKQINLRPGLTSPKNKTQNTIKGECFHTEVLLKCIKIKNTMLKETVRVDYHK